MDEHKRATVDRVLGGVRKRIDCFSLIYRHADSADTKFGEGDVMPAVRMESEADAVRHHHLGDCGHVRGSDPDIAKASGTRGLGGRFADGITGQIRKGPKSPATMARRIGAG
jgi:hypothetical protein